ncbi:CHASE domain-containing protein [Photobacterium nomapromontoriensis]|uniref:CHASE domain-containing protein n=1 Tax=Photobacterium nomapromontoriensis TaxID=2910237 RepID=UPI003D0E6F39
MERRLSLVTILAVLISIILSCLIYRLFYQLETANIQREFELQVEIKAGFLSQAIDVNLEALHSLKLAFDNQGQLDRIHFSALASQILNRHHNIQALEWIPRVDGQLRQQYEIQAGIDIPGFRITERNTRGEMVSASLRNEYYPVYYIEPLAGNEAVVGYDLGSNIRRLEAIHRARDSGMLQISERLDLVQTSSSTAGLFIMFPVYTTVAPPTIMTRRKSLQGFVLGVYRLNDIFNSTNRTIDGKNMVYRLIDTHASSNNRVLYIQNAAGLENDRWQVGYKVTRTVLDQGGREWIIEAVPSEHYFASRRTLLPLQMFIVGVILLGHVLYYGCVVMRRNRLMLKKLDEKNKALDEANKKLERLTRMDAVLGIANRRCFDETLKKEFSRACREEKPLALLLIDIDNFKAFNDTYGHQAGDRCLKLVASELARVLRRPADMLARVGGEEFGIILPNTKNGEVVAKQCRLAVERLGIEHAGAAASAFVTVSIGVASLESVEGHSVETLFNFADSVLYQAKSAGRNSVRVINVQRLKTASVCNIC